MINSRPSLPCMLLHALLGLAAIAGTVHAQDRQAAPVQNETAAEKKPSVTGQSVDSRCGYIARIPAEAKLDSLQSGWNPERLSETRLYVIPQAGMIRFIATVRTLDIPADTINTGSYLYTQADSATEKGTAKIRTYYLPTRNVRIEIIPFGLKGHLYTDASEQIFSSFRWKPGATSDRIEVD